MMNNALISILALAATAIGAPLEHALMPRASIAHDSLSPVAQRIADGENGRLMALFNPALHIAHGCQPYPAVTDAGDTSAGLQDTGNPSAGCRDQSKAQTYARAGAVDGRLGIMYAWYMPKDQPNAGNVAGGHRHDWENIVLIVDGETIVSAAASGHGDYKKTATPQRSGNTVQVEYFTSFPTNHELQFTDTVGVTHAISDWDAMPQAAKDGLSQPGIFGDANPPFKDDNFANSVRKAML